MNTAPLFTVIFGPTASGKTSIALDLAKKYSANILSFDSRQMYYGIDIVTGKDIPDGFFLSTESHPEFGTIRVHSNDTIKLYGFDIVSPDTDWSIAQYYLYALPIIQYHKATQTPLIMVGGSWQYCAVLFEPPNSLFIPNNPELRQKFSQESLENLQILLQNKAPQRWEALNESDRANPRRLIRALEVSTSTSEPPRPLFSQNEAHFIFLQPELSILESHINTRVQDRIQHGALQETQTLLDTYSDWSGPAFTATGYTYLRGFLEGSINATQLEQLWTHQERQYAKRQLTWVKSLLPRFPDAEIRKPFSA